MAREDERGISSGITGAVEHDLRTSAMCAGSNSRAARRVTAFVPFGRALLCVDGLCIRHVGWTKRRARIRRRSRAPGVGDAPSDRPEASGPAPDRAARGPCQLPVALDPPHGLPAHVDARLQDVPSWTLAEASTSEVEAGPTPVESVPSLVAAAPNSAAGGPKSSRRRAISFQSQLKPDTSSVAPPPEASRDQPNFSRTRPAIG